MGVTPPCYGIFAEDKHVYVYDHDILLEGHLAEYCPVNIIPVQGMSVYSRSKYTFIYLIVNDRFLARESIYHVYKSSFMFNL